MRYNQTYMADQDIYKKLEAALIHMLLASVLELLISLVHDK
jgi:hypothetical protein